MAEAGPSVDRRGHEVPLAGFREVPLFEALRTLERLHAGGAQVLLRGASDLDFPDREVVGLRRSRAPGTPVVLLETAVMALLGASGVASAEVTEALARSARADLAAVAHLAGGRLIDLYCQAWALSRPYLAREAASAGPAGASEFDRMLLGWLGFEPAWLERRGIPADLLVRHAALLCHQPVSLAALETLASDWLQVPVLLELEACPAPLPTRLHARLGPLEPASWQRDPGVLASLLPGGERFRRLEQLIDLLITSERPLAATLAVRRAPDGSWPGDLWGRLDSDPGRPFARLDGSMFLMPPDLGQVAEVRFPVGLVEAARARTTAGANRS